MTESALPAHVAFAAAPSPIESRRSLRAVKRGTDVVVAAVALVVLSPLFLAIAVAIKVTSRGHVFFRQVRIGANDEPFAIIKFRTMELGADERKPSYAHLNVHT